jgi:mercuric ion transport protein
MKIHLLYFQGCPNVEPARAALRDALSAEGVDVHVEEVDVEAADAPAWARGWGSPTILIDGKDLAGESRSTGSSCRIYASGAPGVDEIRERIAAGRVKVSP